MLPNPGPPRDILTITAGKLAGGQIRDAFLFQADAGAGRRGHGPDSRYAGAVDHIDGGNLAFRLDESAARPAAQIGCHIFGQFILGRNGIAEITLAAGPDGRFADGAFPVINTLATVDLYRHFRTN